MRDQATIEDANNPKNRKRSVQTSPRRHGTCQNSKVTFKVLTTIIRVTLVTTKKATTLDENCKYILRVHTYLNNLHELKNNSSHKLIKYLLTYNYKYISNYSSPD